MAPNVIINPMSSAIFHLSELGHSAIHELRAPATDDFATDVYLWLERTRSESSRLELEHKARQKRITKLAVLLCVMSVVLGALTWPRSEKEHVLTGPKQHRVRLQDAVNFINKRTIQ